MFYTVQAKPKNSSRFQSVEFSDEGLYVVNRVTKASLFNDKQLENLKNHLKFIHLDSRISFRIKSETGKIIWSI